MDTLDEASGENAEDDKNEPFDIDVDLLVRRAAQRCTVDIVSHMEPGGVLDIFAEEDLFNPITKIIIRDIMELENTSKKNRSIIGKIEVSPHRYVKFKEALARTGQQQLIDILQDAEIYIHDEMKGKGCICRCCSSRECEVLEGIRCVGDLSPHVSTSVRELQKHLIRLYLDQCTRVPLYPLEPEERERVDKFFVRPDMEKVNLARKYCLKELSTEDHLVHSYRDIFHNGTDRCRHIYITGEAGVGKTTFCESMVLTWCNTHTPKSLNDTCSKGDNSAFVPSSSYRNTETGDYLPNGGSSGLHNPIKVETSTNISSPTLQKEDEETMTEFSLLFYITLRDCAGDSSIEEMIAKQLEVDNVSMFLEREKCLIILDGLDEWEAKESCQPSRFVTKGLPRRKMKGNSTILTTTRPWKLEIIRLKSTEIDQQIRMCGIGDESLRKLENDVIAILNESYGQDKSAEDFRNEMDECKLKDLRHIPFILMQMLCLWHGDIDVSGSKRDVYTSMIDRQLEYAEQVKFLPELVPVGSAVIGDLPECFKDKTVCLKYREVLLVLSQLAYQLLCKQSKEGSLVFSHKQTEIYGMTGKQLQFCLKVGLLTQHKTCGKVTEKLKTMSFVHKTYQEFFLAIFLSAQTSFSEIMDLLSQIVYNLETFLEMANVCELLCEMRPDICREMLDYIMDVIGGDRKLQMFRSRWYDTGTEYLQLAIRIQDVVFEIIQGVKSSEMIMRPLRIDDLIIRKNNIDNVLTFRKCIDTSHIKSIYLKSTGFVDNEYLDVQELLSDFLGGDHSGSLVKICIIGADECINRETLAMSCRMAKDTLTCLGLVSLTIKSPESITDLGTTFSDMIQTRILTSLVLRDITCSHQHIDLFVKTLSELTFLKQLNLSDIKCATHDTGSGCSFVLDLSSITQLEELFLYNLSTEDVRIDPSELLELTVIDLPTTTFLHQLKGATKLRQFNCWGFHYPICADTLVDILPGLKGAENIGIQSVDFGNLSPRLSPYMGTLDVVSISHVTISDAGLRDFVDSLPLNGVRVHLNLTLVSRDGEATTTDYIEGSEKFKVSLIFNEPGDISKLLIEFHTIVAGSPTVKQEQ